MVIRTVVGVAALSLVVSGCAGPQWQHSKITDSAKSARQLVIDDAHCLRVALGSAPMPEVIVSPGASTSNFTLQGTTTDFQAGRSTYGSYSGQVTTTPANSFASGMANGMNLGNALGAAVAQRKIHKACMYALGWSDSPLPVVTVQLNGVSEAPAPSSAVLRRTPTKVHEKPLPIYGSAGDAWEADTDEFLTIYPAYRQKPLFNEFNERVKAIASSERGKRLSSPELLLLARQQLIDSGLSTVEPPEETYDLVRSTYRDAARGESLSQAAMGMLWSQGGTAVGVNKVRAAYWTQKSAVAGNPIGQMGYALLRFKGSGIRQDRVDGYRWAQKASAADKSAYELLAAMEAEMTAQELQEVR